MRTNRRGSQVARRTLLAGVALSLLAGAAQAATAAPNVPDLDAFSIEELGQIQITSVSKRPEAVGQAASAVFVITNEDLHRSGAMTLAESLRQAPNLEVTRIDALDYSITARGFSGSESANKLLVLIDGRSIYTPLYSGVDWDQNHVLLDDLDRIEVISGPGGTLWGANAVNGVINVVSRPAQETLGLLAVGNAGTLDSDARLRYGAMLGDNGAFRVYATGYKRGDLKRPSGASANDGWWGLQAGFRTDWSNEAHTLTLQGDVNNNKIDESAGFASGYARGGNLLGRWDWRPSAGGELQVQAYYDRVERKARQVYDWMDTYDVQLQHSFTLGAAHQVIWGAGYRHTADRFHTLTEPQLLSPERRRVGISNVFLQDEIALGRTLALTVGLKLEDDSYTELEALPNVRLAWRPSETQTVWAAVSRAVRNPSRVERDFFFVGLVVPGRFKSESLIAYEAGYRAQPSARSSLSVSLYYNDYDGLRSNDLTAPGVLPIYVGNTNKGRVIGADVWGDYAVASWWRLNAGFSVLDKKISKKAGSLDIAQFESGGVDADHWVKLRSQMKFGDSVDLNIGLRGYGDVPTLKADGYRGAPAYVEADARLAWRVTPSTEISLTGANLLASRHPEASEIRRNENPRSVLLGVRWVR
jgi:iron complex outermembrane receptor protein